MKDTKSLRSQKQQAQQYLQTHLNPILLPLVKQLINNRPSKSNLPQYVLNYITALQNCNASKYSCTISNISPDLNDQIDQTQFRKKLENRNKRESSCIKRNSGRLAISAEVYNNQKPKNLNQEDYQKIKKSQNTKKFIKKAFSQSFLFENQSDDALDELINVMGVKKVKNGESIIKQGETGDTLFVVSDGTYDCFKFMDGRLTHIKTYKAGQIFGQLSIMYNIPRQATILAKTPGKLYTLDRYHFKSITKQIIEKKRQIYKQGLSKVQILQGFNDSQKQKICDVLKQQKYKIGQYIFKQGDEGQKFYFLLQGRIIAQKKLPGQKIPQKVYQFKIGDYFGQIALLKNCPRQASIKAITKCKVAYLNRQTFKRLLGPLEQKLKKNQQKYNNESNKSNKA